MAKPISSRVAPNPRLTPPLWRHDWYTLLRLRQAIQRLVLRRLRRQKRGTLVDFGAGDAPYISLFRGLGHKYVRCDLEGDVDVLIEPEKPLPLADKSAQLVTSFQVLEHVWNLDWYLGECQRILAEDGYLLLSTHGTWLYHPHPTDFRRWTRDGLVAELESRGFKVVEVLPLIGPLAWTTQFRALGYHAILSKIPLVGSTFSTLVCLVMNLRMVVEDRLTPASIGDWNAAVYVMLAQHAEVSETTRSINEKGASQ